MIRYTLPIYYIYIYIYIWGNTCYVLYFINYFISYIGYYTLYAMCVAVCIVYMCKDELVSCGYYMLCIRKATVHIRFVSYVWCCIRYVLCDGLYIYIYIYIYILYMKYSVLCTWPMYDVRSYIYIYACISYTLVINELCIPWSLPIYTYIYIRYYIYYI